MRTCACDKSLAPKACMKKKNENFGKCIHINGFDGKKSDLIDRTRKICIYIFSFDNIY